jgi:hypothetical protein
MRTFSSGSALRAFAVASLGAFALTSTAGADVRVSSGSPPAPFSQNKQNEPALAVDANHPNVLASGSNDEIDEEACVAGGGTTCPFTPGVGVSGISFSFDAGHTWTQPSYPGYSARTCTTPAPCTPLTPAQGGQIGTLPRYYESGLASDGDPALAFGPVYKNGGFSWSNGSRLYYANLTSSLADSKQASSFRGFEALAVSTTDNPQQAAAGGPAGAAAWKAPVIISKQSATTFSDKEQLWADNASSSKYFGYVYVCNASFRSNSKGNGAPEPIVVSRSTDGGTTWTSRQISSAAVNPNNPGRDGCTVRTDHTGVVYVYYRGLDPKSKVEAQLQSRSFDGGRTFETPRAVSGPAKTVGITDPITLRPVEDGLAGARADLAPAPSVDIANGAPTGADASDAIVMAWATGDSSPFQYGQAVYASSLNHGASFSPASPISLGGAHAYYVAPALSPDGTQLYLAYNAFTSDYQPTTGTQRSLVGGLLSAPFVNGKAGAFASRSTPVAGDPRGSSQNNLVAEFLGDYVYAIGTRTGGAGVWNDMRYGADCPSVDAYRQRYAEEVRAGRIPPNAQEDSPADDGGADAPASSGTPPPAPDVTACPATFGNSDIFGATTIPAPTP